MVDRSPTPGTSGLRRTPPKLLFSESTNYLDDTTMNGSSILTNEIIGKENLSLSFNTGLQNLGIDTSMDIMDWENTTEKNASPENSNEFATKMKQLKPIERKTAQAFIDSDMTDNYLWPKENESQEEMKIRKTQNSNCLRAERMRKARSKETPEVRQKRLQSDAKHHQELRNQETPEVRQKRLQSDAKHRQELRNQETPGTKQKRLQTDAKHHQELRTQETPDARQKRLKAMAQYNELRNQETPDATQQRLEADAEHHRIFRLPGQLERQGDTVEAQENRQLEFEQRESRKKANYLGCISVSFKRVIKEHNVGSTKTTRGGYSNLCQHCNAIRYPGEKESICCQKGKVILRRQPDFPPILNALSLGNDPRSKVYKKHIKSINSFLSMACIKVKHKNPRQDSTYNPSVIIQGKVYYYMPPLESEEGKTMKFASVYLHDPALEETDRRNNLYLP